MKTLYIVARPETIHEFLDELADRGIATIMYPLDNPRAAYPEPNQPIAVFPTTVGSGVTLMGFVRTVSPALRKAGDAYPYVRLTVGRKIKAAPALIPVNRGPSAA